MVKNRPKRKTRVGQPSRWPLTPKETGTVVPAASGMRRMIPALTRPMKAMKAPMPTTMAYFRSMGTASMIICRTRVTVSSMKNTPEMKTAPRPVCQL